MNVLAERAELLKAQLRQVSLLAEIAALDDGDEPFAWKHEDLFNRIHMEVDAREALESRA